MDFCLKDGLVAFVVGVGLLVFWKVSFGGTGGLLSPKRVVYFHRNTWYTLNGMCSLVALSTSLKTLSTSLKTFPLCVSGDFYQFSGNFYQFSGNFYRFSGNFYRFSDNFYQFSDNFYQFSGALVVRLYWQLSLFVQCSER